MQTIRQKLHQVIDGIKPFDDKEIAHKAYVLEWIGTGAELFRRVPPATPDPHLVSYFLLMDECSNKVLLVDHKKAELWLPPGGHVEPNEDPKATVIREAQEELGIEADFLIQDPLFLTVTKTRGSVTQHTDVTLWYVLKGDSSETLSFDKDEFHHIRWFAMDELPLQRTDPHLERFIDKFKLHVSCMQGCHERS